MPPAQTLFLSTSGLAAGLSTAESLPVVDAALLELLILLHGIVCLDSVMLVMDIFLSRTPAVPASTILARKCTASMGHELLRTSAALT